MSAFDYCATLQHSNRGIISHTLTQQEWEVRLCCVMKGGHLKLLNDYVMSRVARSKCCSAPVSHSVFKLLHIKRTS